METTKPANAEIARADGRALPLLLFPFRFLDCGQVGKSEGVEGAVPSRKIPYSRAKWDFGKNVRDCLFGTDDCEGRACGDQALRKFQQQI